MTTPDEHLTQLLQDAALGDAAACEQAMEAVDLKLRALARSRTPSHQDDGMLQPTALVNEAFIKIFGMPSGGWNDRHHFYSVAALAMRQVCIDYARRVSASRRRETARAITISGVDGDSYDADDFLDLDAAIARLATIHKRQADVVVLRFFSGLSVKDVALALGVSERTVEVDWRVARAWLRAALEDTRH